MISIVIPVYNVQQYLRECVDSVVSQTYKDIEILLVDDGSTDESSIICDEYARSDTRIKVFHRKNEGLSASRQFGFDMAKGEYVMTIDSDDYIVNDCVEILYKNIKEYNTDIACCCRYDFLNDYKKIVLLSVSEENPIVTNQNYIVNHLDFLSEKVWLSDSWNKLYKISFVRESGVRFELSKRFNGNDLVFNYKLALHCPSFSIVNKPLLYHRLTPNSIVRRKNKPLQEGFEMVLEQIINETKKCHYLPDINNELSQLYSNLLLLVVLDIERDTESIGETRHRLSQMYIKNEVFMKEHSDMNLVPKKGSIFTTIVNSLLRRGSCLKLALLLHIHKNIGEVLRLLIVFLDKHLKNGH